MKIAILTSSRADFGVYLPLLKKLESDSFFNMEIVAFGTHLSKKHGYTIDQIENENFSKIHRLDTTPEGDAPKDISKAIAETIAVFSDFWSENSYDLIFALGDRYEMFAAVASALPFNIKVAHIHGGETTLGAIDNAFRHSITLMSKLHFASTEKYMNRIIEIIVNSQNVYNVGALSIDNLEEMSLLSIAEFKNKYKIDLSKPSILITFHPETVGFDKNEKYVHELINALNQLKEYQLIITMPNADTKGNFIREKLNQFINSANNAIGVENFGALGYLSCMKHCAFMLGNTSSGFVEASYFPKYVINIGDRQKGRIITPNIFSIPILSNDILTTVNHIKNLPLPAKMNIYGQGNTAEKILDILKTQL